MSTAQIKDWPNGARTEEGGDGSIAHDSVFLFETADGSATRRISLADLMAFMGIQVGTLIELTGPGSGDNYLAFGTDVRKVGEGVGEGTGSLLMSVDQSTWDIVEDNSSAAT